MNGLGPSSRLSAKACQPVNQHSLHSGEVKTYVVPVV